MKGYVIAQATVMDPARYEEYKRLAQQAVEKYGGRYVVRQGTALGRDGRVYLEREGADIWVGGEVVCCIEGTVSL